MVPRDHDESERIAEQSEETSDVRPRVFVWGQPQKKRSLLQRIADRFRRNGGPGEPVLPPVVRPVVGRQVAADEPTSASSERPPPILPAVDGREPPDLTTDEPPLEGASEEEESAKIPKEDHGPGPLYRATLQLLPGRLRPLDPDIVREEIRFVRPTGARAAVTLGWEEGEPPGHITVNHPSVQDRHARMSFVDRQWYIESLVASHPVRVNEEPVPAGADPRELQSGDEVWLGDASFHFLMP